MAPKIFPRLKNVFVFAAGVALFASLPCASAAQTAAPKPAPQAASQTKAAPSTAPPAKRAALVDLTRQPTLYVIGYAHLDTEWRWEYPQTIQEYLSKTMRNNFALFEKYPHYIFNFTGANRYMFMKEYFPADFERIKHYVALGRWFPAGSSMEENDVNSPNAESIIRQVLYGNEFFRKEFGKASNEYMLPDCFGFPASLPSVLAHAGIKGFSTQKLNAGWQPAPHVGGPDSPEKTPEGIPFNVGVWQGPDGATILAALNPSSYVSDVYTDLSKDNTPPPDGVQRLGNEYVWNWPSRVNLDGKVTGLFGDFHYVGTGDIGGSPNEFSIRLMEAIESKGMTVMPALPERGRRSEQQTPEGSGTPVRAGDGPLRVMWAPADQMFADMQGHDLSKMPRWQGDLELINHSAGSISSQTYHKRWNRMNETLAQAAEEASVGAMWLGGRAYPQERLNRAWRLLLAGQFHDSMAGTATPQSYNYIWNDDAVAMNQFSGVITSATEAIASAMDTQASGTPIVVFNSLGIAREDLAEADVNFTGTAPNAVRVTNPAGKQVPAQVVRAENGVARVLFAAKTPSVGFAVYDVQPLVNAAIDAESELKVTDSSLENARYRVHLNEEGDVSSIFDKKTNKELLHSPVRLAISTDNPAQWPAWNMDFEDEQHSPRSYVSGPAKIRVTERGPVRVAIEVERETEGSKFIQTIRLASGDAGNRVEFGNVIDWHTTDANLKAVFSLNATNKNATYNWDIGTIERPNEFDRQFEVASHQWIDLTDQSGAFGAMILTDAKSASDKPDDNTVRLTLVRTPGTRGGYTDQGSQDLGHHEFVFGLAGHDGDWRQGETDWQAWRLNQPLMAFESAKHAGALGKEFSLVKVSNSRVRLLAMKKAEASDEIVVRLVEISGKPESDVHIAFAAPVIAAREINGQEQPVGAASSSAGDLVASFKPYQPRTFAVKLAAAKSKAAPRATRPVALAYDVSVASVDGKPSTGCFDCYLDSQNANQGRAIPAELLPHDLDFNGVHFTLAPAGTGKPDAVTARGQTINLPAGKFNRVYILAAAAPPSAIGQNGDPRMHGDARGTFKIGDQSVDLTIADWTGFVGQWDDRGWTTREEVVPINRPANAPPLPLGAPTTRIRRTTEFNGQLTPGFIKRADIAWFASHRHDSAGANEAYAYSYLFAYAIDVPAGAKTLTLPTNELIRILAVSVAGEPAGLTPAHPLYDTLEISGSGAK
jgi:alpha-mannosidase